MSRRQQHRRIERLEQEARQAEARGETLQAIQLRRALYNAQVKLWKQTTGER